MSFKDIKLELGWRNISKGENGRYIMASEKQDSWGSEGGGHVERIVVRVENNSVFSDIEPLSVPQGIFVFFLLYLR